MQQIWIKTTNQEMLAQDQRKANKFEEKKTTNLSEWWNSSKSVLIFLFDKHKDKHKRQNKTKTRTITMANTKKIINQPV